MHGLSIESASPESEGLPSSMLAIFENALDLLLVIVGFGLIIFIHELGHFVAARWAGIRVLAFALGFGPAVFSYRRGMGLRRGSSEPAYLQLIAEAKGQDPQLREAARAKLAGAGGSDQGAVSERSSRSKPAREGISPTEYRLNWLPFGGYVKMLGQEDANPQAVSNAPDSYQNCPPLKRMVVISAGVVANVITAFLLFIAVFMIGLRTEPAAIGMVNPGGPAASARLISLQVANGMDATDGLRAGDRVLLVNGEHPRHFNDFATMVAMSAPGRNLKVQVEREGLEQPLLFEVKPERDRTSRLFDIGVRPVQSTRIDPGFAEVDGWSTLLETMGLPGLEPGMRMVSLDGTSVSELHEAVEIVRNSQGRPLRAIFEHQGDAQSSSPQTDGTGNSRVEVMITPAPEFQVDDANADSDVITPVTHLLGLMPVLRVNATADRGAKQGLLAGDVFTRLGEVEYPSELTGVREIRRHAGRTLQAAVLRTDAQTGEQTEVELNISVSREGTIGFEYTSGDAASTLMALPPAQLWALDGGMAYEPAARRLVTRPGSRITAIGDTQVTSFTEIRNALREATSAAWLGSAGDGAGHETGTTASVKVSFADQPEAVWTLNSSDLAKLHGLSYGMGAISGLFEFEQFTLAAQGPANAIGLGLSETRRIMQQAYLTFLRLFQGSVRVEHLRGPVGIAHIGTMIADRGMVWLMFYMAMVSINLAVVNFLPLPIVDGGQFIMLIYEKIRGKPVPMGLQGALTLAGLAMVGAIFLIVTFNDISNLLGR